MSQGPSIRLEIEPTLVDRPDVPERTVKIRLDGAEVGPLTFRELGHLITAGKVTRNTPMWSERWQQWTTVAEALDEFYPENKPSLRLDDMRSAGVRFAELLGTNDERDCPACRALAGKVFSIDQVPSIPPDGCTCEPWCRCVYVAAQGQNAAEPIAAPKAPGKVGGLSDWQWIAVLLSPVVLIFAAGALFALYGEMTGKNQERREREAEAERVEAVASARRTQVSNMGWNSGSADAVQTAVAVSSGRMAKPAVAQVRALGLTRADGQSIEPELREEFLDSYERAFRSEFKKQTGW